MNTACNLAFILLLGAAPSALAIDHYDVVALPHPGGELDGFVGGAWWVTDAGVVAGMAYDVGGETRALVWTHDGADWSMTVLPSLGGTRDLVYASNAIGHVYGASTLADGTSLHAVQWTQDGNAWTATDLGTLGGLVSSVHGVNAGHLLVGVARDGNDDFHAVTWDADGIHDLAFDPDIRLMAAGVNNLEQIVGGGYWDRSAFLWLPEPAYGMTAGFHDLPTLGGTTSDCALKINDHGLVCGYCADPDGIRHPVLWRDGALIDLTPDSVQPGWAQCHDLNERNQVVGNAIDDAGAQYAFLWEDDVLHRLDEQLVDGRWTMSVAVTINEAGWIGGYGRFEGGLEVPMLLLPRPCASIPGDVNGDGVVDVADLLIVLANWG